MMGLFTESPFSIRFDLVTHVAIPTTRGNMSKKRYLTPDEVVERYRGMVSIRTLANWRSLRQGPKYLRCGKAVLYDEDELDAWDHRNTVKCVSMIRDDQQ